MTALDLLAVGALATIWGTNFLFVDWALTGMTPGQVVMARLCLGATILVLLAFASRVRFPRTLSAWGRLTAMGLIGQGVPWLLFAWGQETVPAALAGVYTGMTPLLTIPMAWLLMRTSPSRWETSACVIGFVGLALVLSPWSSGGTGGPVSGQLLCLAGAVCYACGFAYAARILRDVKEHKLSLAAVQAVATTIVMAPLNSTQIIASANLHGMVVAGVVLLGVGSALAFVINYWLIARVGPVRSSLAFYLIPVVAVVVGIFFQHERLSGVELAGAAVVVAGLAVVYHGEGTKIISSRTLQQ